MPSQCTTLRWIGSQGFVTIKSLRTCNVNITSFNVSGRLLPSLCWRSGRHAADPHTCRPLFSDTIQPWRWPGRRASTIMSLPAVQRKFQTIAPQGLRPTIMSDNTLSAHSVDQGIIPSRAIRWLTVFEGADLDSGGICDSRPSLWGICKWVLKIQFHFGHR